MQSDDVALVEQMLSRLRAQRDNEHRSELRHAYNEACDRLDVLASKLSNPERYPPEETE